MARDRAACVARQAAVSRHGVGRSRLLSGRAWRTRGAQWARGHGASRRSRGAQAAGARWRWASGRAGAGGRQRHAGRAWQARCRAQQGHDRGAWGPRPGLGARPGRAGWPGLCTWCTRLVFGPIRLGIFPESNFLTLFVSPVHERCSSQNFSKKQFIKLNKNQIKSNKIRQNFRKIKFSKNKILENKILLKTMF